MATLTANHDVHHALGSFYMNMMRHLSDATKLEIIRLLSASLLHKYETAEDHPENKKINLYSCFTGDWGKDIDTSTYCEELRRDLLPTKDIDL